MDSLTQFALGASVALMVTARRHAPRQAAWKIALVGGVVGTLPDLDAFIDFGDAISNMVRHRAETHGFFYATLASPLIAYLVSKWLGDSRRFVTWCLAVWLILVTHVGLDLLTIYGTQIAQPFNDTAFGVGSLFVIDPLYTLPLILGLVVTIIRSGPKGLRWNTFGLVFSSAYILWSLGAHQHATDIAKKHPPTDDQSMKILVSAAPLTTVLWRAVAVTPDVYYEGWYSLLDPEPKFSWQAYPRNAALIQRYELRQDVARIARFTHGFFRLEEAYGKLFVTDLRLGLEPYYSFRFDLGDPNELPTIRSQRVGVRPDLAGGLPWLWHRIQGNPITLTDYVRASSR